MNVLSLFDGMSCGRIALERANIPITNYYASEIDKYAIKVSTANYPDIVHIGDVLKVDWFGLPKIDLLMGGSPCQGFSFAGKQLNFNDPRSALFFEFVRIKNELQPKYFLLENVMMKKEYQDIISENLGVQPIMINSALVSAQNRKRLYWTNIPNITQPEDKGIVIRDIIEYEFDNDTISLNHYKPMRVGNVTTVQKDNVLCIQVGNAGISNRRRDDAVYSVDGKNPTLMANSGGQKEPKISINEIYWRKLTPLECERLQTVPDSFTNHVSNSQRYKMLGNGWTVDVVAHILKGIL